MKKFLPTKQWTIDNGQLTKKNLSNLPATLRKAWQAGLKCQISNAFGFTLIELLVVVTIIAILSVIGIAIFTDVQKSARDARRKVDIDAIAGVLEAEYNSANNTYLTAISGAMFSSGIEPTDPLGTRGGHEIYNKDLGGTGYTLCAKMEKGGGNSNNRAFGGTGTDYYCRRSLQN